MNGFGFLRERRRARRPLAAALATILVAAGSGAAHGPVSPAAPATAIGDDAPQRDGASEFPADWFWGNEAQRRAHDSMVGKPPPPLSVSRWIGAEQKLADLRGKVVVVDFWATWCGPCIRAMPVNKQMIEQHKDHGLVFIGIHDHRRGLDRLDAVMAQHAVTYPVAVDDGGKSARAWNLAFWPTYGVIDRNGIVRAVGLQPARVPDVVKTLIAEPVPDDLKPKEAPADARSGLQRQADETVAYATPLPREWTERLPARRGELERLLAAPAPPLPDGEWINSAPLTFESLRGKVVLLDFWATWCVPCIKAIPDLNRFQERFAERGLVVVGICHARGAESMAETAEKHRIRYPIVSDPTLAAVKAYGVDTYPDYYLIDRAGRVRGVDLRFEHLETAIQALLAE